MWSLAKSYAVHSVARGRWGIITPSSGVAVISRIPNAYAIRSAAYLTVKYPWMSEIGHEGSSRISQDREIRFRWKYQSTWRPCMNLPATVRTRLMMTSKHHREALGLDKVILRKF